MVTLLQILGPWRRHALHVLVCVALVVSSLAASVGHVPQYSAHVAHAETDHGETGHGHTHDPIDELWWSLHGHAHDQVDHDHSPITLPRPLDSKVVGFRRLTWRWPGERIVSAHNKPPRRPPRG